MFIIHLATLSESQTCESVYRHHLKNNLNVILADMQVREDRLMDSQCESATPARPSQ
ncbi:hypothetical protein [Bdellovibrio sp. HCB337]|uniref:hypothetical protein n=1 Tax=Bdellovibrio sp. HCB337 TaxID=3394358 RepID=UPI0039A607C9